MLFLKPKCERSCFFVQRASLSFWRFLASFDFQSSGVSPSLIVSFSSRELCCLGADTIAELVQTISRDVALYGPGDIVGIEARAIFRTDPPTSPFIANYESNYLAAIEFYHED